MSIFHAVYTVVCACHFLILKILTVLTPLSKLNTVLQIRIKMAQIQKKDEYSRILSSPVPNRMYFDFHFYRMAIYIKHAQLVCAFVLDFALGISIFFLLSNYTNEILRLLH